MVSPELLRRYAFFSLFSASELREIAMISEEMTLEGGADVFCEGEPADALYLLLKGNIELHFTGGDTRRDPEVPVKEFFVGEINPGEPFGISALIGREIYTSTARADRPSQVLKVNAAKLLDLSKKDDHLAYVVMEKAAKAFEDRLRFTRIQLAAARD